MSEIDNSGYTPLLKACEQGYPLTLEVLLKNHANPNEQNNITGDTGFHYLARNKKKTSLQCAKLLISYGGLPKTMNKLKKLPIDEAIEQKQSDLAKLYEDSMNEKKKNAEQVGAEIIRNEEEKILEPVKLISSLTEHENSDFLKREKSESNKAKKQILNSNLALGFPNGMQLAPVIAQIVNNEKSNSVLDAQISGLPNPLIAEKNKLLAILKEAFFIYDRNLIER